jgi:hypothetical protein
VEDTLAGQEVSCPDCQQTLRAPARAAAAARTSHLALASAALALAGAFTLVGSLTAVGLGAAALVLIARHRDRLTGTGFAAFGLGAGVLFTALTLLALSSPEWLDVDGRLRQRLLVGRVDTSGPLEIDLGKGWSLSRPSEGWGRLRGERSDDPAVYPLQKDRELILLNPQLNAYVDVRDDPSNLAFSGDQMIRQDLLGRQETPGPNLGAAPDDEESPFGGATQFKRIGAGRQLEAGGWVVKEYALEVRRGGRPWHFLVRSYEKPVVLGGAGPVRCLVRAYTPARRFQANEAELRRALDSFRLKPGA